MDAQRGGFESESIDQPYLLWLSVATFDCGIAACDDVANAEFMAPGAGKLLRVPSATMVAMDPGLRRPRPRNDTLRVSDYSPAPSRRTLPARPLPPAAAGRACNCAPNSTCWIRSPCASIFSIEMIDWRISSLA